MNDYGMYTGDMNALIGGSDAGQISQQQNDKHFVPGIQGGNPYLVSPAQKDQSKNNLP